MTDAARPAHARELAAGRPGRRIRVSDARTIHGNDGANARAANRYRLTLMSISRVVIALDRCHAHLPPAFAAHRPPQGAPTPGPTPPFEPSRIDPLNREPKAKPSSSAPFKPFRIDPLNREPGAFPDPDPQPAHRFHETAQIRESTRCAANAEPAPQARKFLPQMNADER
jgi:hypothetical protein